MLLLEQIRVPFKLPRHFKMYRTGLNGTMFPDPDYVILHFKPYSEPGMPWFHQKISWDIALQQDMVLQLCERMQNLYPVPDVEGEN